MVARRHWLLYGVLGCLLPIAQQAAAAAALNVRAQAMRLEYGQSLSVDLSTDLRQPALDTIDLKVLDEHYVVHTPESAVRQTADGRQSWRITLTPRRAGELPIPALDFAGVSSRPLSIQVDSARDASNRPLQVEMMAADALVWLQQAVPVRMQIETSDSLARLKIAHVAHAGMTVVPRPARREALMRNGERRYRDEIGWTLSPQSAGEHLIQLPAVEYERDGVVTHRFYPPRIRLQVRPLPAFVPPTVAVGRVRIHAGLPDQWFLNRRELAFMTLRIDSDHPEGQGLSGIAAQLRSDSAIEFYPARRVQQAVDSDGARVYEIPFAPKGAGWISLPSLRLQFFDPETGKIHSERVSLGRVIVLSHWMMVLGGLGVAIVTILVVVRIQRWMRRQIGLHRHYGRAISRLRHAQTPDDIKSALMQIAAAESWPANISLRDWQQRWARCHPRLPAVMQEITQLQAWQYGRRPSCLDDIRPHLIDLCHRRVPLVRWLLAARGDGRWVARQAS